MEGIIACLHDEESDVVDGGGGSASVPYTGDTSFTSFDLQLRVARQREQQRRKQEERQQRMHNSASVLMNGSSSSIQERIQKFQIGKTVAAAPEDSVNSSMSSLGAEKLLFELPDEEEMKGSKDSGSDIAQPSAVAHKSNNKSVLSIQEKLRLARERGQNRQQPKGFKDRMHMSVPNMLPEEDDGDSDDEDEEDSEDIDLRFNNSCSVKAPYTGDESFTSFDDQIRIARRREAERRKAEMKAKLGGSSSSIKDRMKMFNK